MSEQNLQPVEAIEPTDTQEPNIETEEKPSEQEIAIYSADHMRIVNMRNLDNHFYRIAKIYASTDIVPASYRENPGNCFIAMRIADRMGLEPTFVMQNLYIVKGRPSWSGQACIALINGCGLFKDGVSFEWIGEEGKDSFGCVCTAIKKSTGELLQGSPVTMAMVQGEGWWSKKDKYGNETSKWQTMARQMFMYRAATFFARVHCPNVLMGFSIEGEADDIVTVSEPEIIKA